MYVCMHVWKHGVWKHGSMETWKYGNIEVWKYGSMYGCMKYMYVCVNIKLLPFIKSNTKHSFSGT